MIKDLNQKQIFTRDNLTIVIIATQNHNNDLLIFNCQFVSHNIIFGKNDYGKKLPIGTHVVILIIKYKIVEAVMEVKR